MRTIRVIWVSLLAIGMGSCGGGDGSGGSAPGSPPSSFTLLSPPNGSTSVLLAPTLTWTDSTVETSYTVQVATDSAFASIVYQTTSVAADATSFPVPSAQLAGGTVYFWRAIAVNGTGQTTASNAPFDFMTKTLSFATVFDTGRPGTRFWAGGFSDLNGDGVADLSVTEGVADQTITWYEGVGFTQLLSVPATASGTAFSSMANTVVGMENPVDLDGDAATEFVLVQGTTVQVLNAATGAIEYTHPPFVGASNVWPVVADLDGNGIYEVIITVTFGATDYQVLVLEWQGAYSTVFDTGRPGTRFWAGGFSDLNGDGVADLSVTEGVADQTITWYEGVGFTQLLSVPATASGTAFSSMANTVVGMENPVDLDGDAATEFVLVQGTTVQVLNAATGAIEYTHPPFVGASNVWPVVADLDGNGIYEVIITVTFGATDYQVLVLRAQ